MYAEFATDEKVLAMSDSDQIRLVRLFCLRCSRVTEEMPDRQIAAYLRVSMKQLPKTKSAFLEGEFINEDWSIRNWGKRQIYAKKAAERKRRSRERCATESPPIQRDETRDGHAECHAVATAQGQHPDDQNLELRSKEKTSKKEMPPANPNPFNQPPEIVSQDFPTDRRGQNLADWNAALGILESDKNLKPLAEEMKVEDGSPLFRSLEGWQFLHAARVVSRPGNPSHWGYFRTVFSGATRRQFEEWGKPRQFGPEQPSHEIPTERLPCSRTDNVDPETLAYYESLSRGRASSRN